MRFLNDLAILETNIKGSSIEWDIQYETKDIICPKEDPFCKFIP